MNNQEHPKIKNPLVSIVVPVFNTYNYLDKCIFSLVEQSYRNIEIILINDGSTDDSLIKCKQWAKKDCRIKLFSTSNQGQGSARNLGVKESKGDFVMFVDSDDWIERDTLSSLLRLIEKEDFDVICFANDSSHIKTNNEIITFNNSEIMFEHLLNKPGTGHSPCDKLIKRELLMDHKFPSIKSYEDAATIYKIFADSKRVAYVNTIFYHYLQRNESVMHHSFSQLNFIQVSVYNEMFLFYTKKYKQHSKYAKRLLCGSIQYCIGEYLLLKNGEYLIKQYKDTIKIAKKISYRGLKIKNKICLFLIKHALWLYKFLYKVLS